jgi:hypothetical protein
MRKSNIFETKARNRQMEMQIMSAMEQRSAQELKERGAIDAEMQKYFNAVNELEVLERDQTRIQAKDKELRAGVINSLKQYNGNVKAFMLSGGAGVLNNYYNNLMQSEEVKGALENKTNYVQFQHAQANGLYVKPVGVDVEVVQPDGTIKKERQVVSMDKALELYEKDKISKLPWDGAEKNVPISADYFQRIYKDPSNIYSKDNLVTPQDIYLKVLEEGRSVEQAQEKAKNYEMMLQNGATPWRYKTGDPLDYQLKREKLRGLRMSNRAASGGFGKGTKIDLTKRLMNLGIGQRANIMPGELEVLSDPALMNLFMDKETGKMTANKDIPAFDIMTVNNPKPAQYNLKDLGDLQPIEFVKTANGLMLKMRAEYDINNASEGSHPMYEGFWGNNRHDENAHINNFTADDNDIVSGEVYVPMDRYMGDRYFRSLANKQSNITADTELYMPMNSHESQINQFLQQSQAGYDILNEVIGQDVDPAISGYLIQSLYNNQQQGYYGSGDSPTQGQGVQWERLQYGD